MHSMHVYINVLMCVHGSDMAWDAAALADATLRIISLS
jgi:hypothetical protein